jgi:hypothetical protein
MRGGWLRHVRDLPKRSIRENVIRAEKIGVVEYVEELKAKSQAQHFPNERFLYFSRSLSQY